MRAYCPAFRVAAVLLVVSGCASEPPLPPLGRDAGRSCPQWTLFPVNRYSNADSPYLGCVSAVNLRAMVADPADLERGRPLGPADGERQTGAIEAYRQGKIKPFQGAGASSPSSSGGGQ